MHNQTDQMKRPMRAGHAEKLASRVGSGGNVRSGESPDASTQPCRANRNGSHLWSAPSADGWCECLWCGDLAPLRSNDQVQP